MQISLAVIIALSFGIGLVDASETDEGQGIAAAPQCIVTTTHKCRKTATLSGTAVPVPEPLPVFAAQAKRFLPAY